MWDKIYIMLLILIIFKDNKLLEKFYNEIYYIEN